ncbi:hypothetical protein ACFL2C_00690 [Patescibacteria group bacterium]
MSNKHSTSELKYHKQLVKLYLKHGSLDEVFKSEGSDLPFSYPHAHRILNDWGVVKSVGRQRTGLAETIYFFDRLAKEKIPIEKLKRSMPHRFHASASSLHRAYRHIRNGLTQREATAILMLLDSKVLVGNDLTSSRLHYGKIKGSKTIPVSFSSKHENPYVSLLRTLQQEVFSAEVVEKKSIQGFIPKTPKPFLLIDIADVRCRVYYLRTSAAKLKKFKLKSYKLENLRFVPMSKVPKKNYSNTSWRPGIPEIIIYYFNIYAKNPSLKTPHRVVAELNKEVIER